jgi:hypothetical protein
VVPGTFTVPGCAYYGHRASAIPHSVRLKVCAHRLWLYVRPSDPTCESDEEMAESEVEARVTRVSGKGIMVNLGNSQTLLHQGIPSTRVWVFTVF